VREALTPNVTAVKSFKFVWDCRGSACILLLKKDVRQLLGVPNGYTLISLVAGGNSDDRPSPAKKPLELET